MSHGKRFMNQIVRQDCESKYPNNSAFKLKNNYNMVKHHACDENFRQLRNMSNKFSRNEAVGMDDRQDLRIE